MKTKMTLLQVAILHQGIDALEIGNTEFGQAIDFLHDEHPVCLSEVEWNQIESELQDYNEGLGKIRKIKTKKQNRV